MSTTESLWQHKSEKEIFEDLETVIEEIRTAPPQITYISRKQYEELMKSAGFPLSTGFIGGNNGCNL